MSDFYVTPNILSFFVFIDTIGVKAWREKDIEEYQKSEKVWKSNHNCLIGQSCNNLSTLSILD